MKFLVIDNDGELHYAAKRVISSTGEHEVISLHTVKFALETLALEKPDIVLCDYMMYGEKGTDFLQKVTSYDHRKIFMLSAYSDPEVRKECLSFGIGGYIEKPIKKIDVTRAIDYVQSLNQWIP